MNNHRRYLLQLLTIATITLLSTLSPAQTVIEDSLFTPSLGRVMHYNLLLPEAYTQSRPYPMLMLLHGFSGNFTNWNNLTGLRHYTHDLPLIIVMPDGENSWYVDQKSKPSEQFEEYLVRDLIWALRQKHELDTTRLAIGGLSMGGYGALVLGLRHPDTFSFIAALSASLDIPSGIPELARHGRDGMRPWIVAAFGDSASDFWREHDPFTLITRLDPGRTPYIYLASGIQDEFHERLVLYRAFADSLRLRGFRYEYHETPGRHNWEYWDRQIQEVLLDIRQLWELPETDRKKE